MHDIRAIRENPQAFDAALARRGVAPAAGNILTIDSQRRLAVMEAESGQARRKLLSSQFGQAKAKGEMPSLELVAELEELKAALALYDVTVPQQDVKLAALLAQLPNLPADDVPDGMNEQDNVEQHRRGDPSAGGRDHADFGPALGLDFVSAQKVSGARFVYLRGPIARLGRALGQFMLDRATTEFAYQEVAPPLLVRDHAMFGTAQLPKFTGDQFTAADQNGRADLLESALDSFDDAMRNAAQAGQSYRERFNELLMAAPTREQFWLIPTAEVSLTNIVRDEILNEDALPLRFTALTPCFRSEAGAAGRDTRGLIRQHQFDKVELVSITTPEQSEAEHERMTACAEGVLDALALPYRRMLLCAGDMGFAARKTYDLEVWLPGQAAYREISSCSNCGDFQARRMNARYRAGPKDNRFVHTLNGSALAVGRTLVAVLENYQNEDGSVTVPDVLLSYMGGVTKLTPHG